MTALCTLAAATALALVFAVPAARALDLPKGGPTPVLVGIYNATPPVLSDGQQAGFQLDGSGNLKVNVAVGGGGGGGSAALPPNAATATGQAAQQGSVTPGTPAAFSVLTGGVYNATAPTVANGQQAAIQLDATGNQKVVAVGGATAAIQNSILAKLPAPGTAASPSTDVQSEQPPSGAVWPVATPTPATIKAGQAKISVTGTVVQLASNTLVNGVTLKAKASNTAPIMVGGTGVTNTYDGTGTGFPLEAGASISLSVSNTNAVFFNGSANDVLSWAAN